MKNIKELSAGEIKHIVWGNSNEMFTRTLSLALAMGVLFFITGSSWAFSLLLVIAGLANWTWRLYTLEVKTK